VFQVFCLDGDASVIMHMGALSVIGQMSPRNLKHIVFNNGAHDSVGGQQTAAFNSSTFHFTKIAVGNGYIEVQHSNFHFRRAHRLIVICSDNSHCESQSADIF
jgi:Thiamine pyrophosphate-requiring enzymes [acetolactate synthase, pyruvate dehydrogenase (cytochrome), glyoxylate carboligase, phosphonopyruvate decarboxylase]